MADDDIALCLTPQAFHNVNVSPAAAALYILQTLPGFILVLGQLRAELAFVCSSQLTAAWPSDLHMPRLAAQMASSLGTCHIPTT